jgi:hypothetical protein
MSASPLHFALSPQKPALSHAVRFSLHGLFPTGCALQVPLSHAPTEQVPSSEWQSFIETTLHTPFEQAVFVHGSPSLHAL